jgi:hypothetical protein
LINLDPSECEGVQDYESDCASSDPREPLGLKNPYGSHTNESAKHEHYPSKTLGWSECGYCQTNKEKGKTSCGVHPECVVLDVGYTLNFHNFRWGN